VSDLRLIAFNRVVAGRDSRDLMRNPERRAVDAHQRRMSGPTNRTPIRCRSRP